MCGAIELGIASGDNSHRLGHLPKVLGEKGIFFDRAQMGSVGSVFKLGGRLTDSRRAANDVLRNFDGAPNWA